MALTDSGAAAVPKPLFRDPVQDGAADPTVIWNRAAGEWWIFYTNRRVMAPPLDDVSWVFGTDIGIAASADGGATWSYRGTAQGLETEWGRNTYWAPEIVDDGSTYHMYVSYIVGVHATWGAPAEIRHYTSVDLEHWEFQSTLDLNSKWVIDACVFPLPDGGWRMWFKQDNHTYAADSPDLFHWTPIGFAVGNLPHEGPNVFALDGSFWMLTDEWAGLRVHRSDDLLHWNTLGRILAEPGLGTDDGGNGLHADVVVVGDEAFVFYFTHPGRGSEAVSHSLQEHRRTSLQVARARMDGDVLVCDRNEILTAPILPIDGL
ncbi:glycoside hydrolase [Arthrobacter sp. M4]|uniref:glycoside hydrolase n=1 Tax=Arthrobacter sp. M4 TaxID=218160 RepID=UPI001CDD2603|nr:glycoside hydrolase [Arthrobacter sp. M4]MCA4131875.1 glycoside hydrolase [Arthrobacter sp. M4]